MIKTNQLIVELEMLLATPPEKLHPLIVERLTELRSAFEILSGHATTRWEAENRKAPTIH